MNNLWLFSLTQPLSADQAPTLAQRLQDELQHWKAHGTPVPCRVTFRHGHFLFIEALEDASGCSIDWLHHTVQQVLADMHLELADSGSVFFWADDAIRRIDFRQIPQALSDGVLTPYTRVFDSQAWQQGDFDRWEAPLQHTWLARYLPEHTH